MNKTNPKAMLIACVVLTMSVLSGDAQEAQQPQAPGQKAQPKAATPEEIRKTSVEAWFGRLENDEKLGYARFTALNALVEKAKGSTNTCTEVIRRASETLDDRKQNLFKRWQCCYVLSGVCDPRGIPAIKRALKDPSEVVRGVAVCALGAFEQPEARSALEKAAETEQLPSLRKEIEKALRGEYRPKKQD